MVAPPAEKHKKHKKHHKKHEVIEEVEPTRVEEPKLDETKEEPKMEETKSDDLYLQEIENAFRQ
jgi:hypothetical protein